MPRSPPKNKKLSVSSVELSLSWISPNQKSACHIEVRLTNGSNELLRQTQRKTFLYV